MQAGGVVMVEPELFHDQLLATKFFLPSSSHPLLPRPHLTSLLNEGLRRKLIFISAPAGFGKTTLISAWVQSLSQHTPEAPHVAWVSLDESDNDPVQFWTYALTALDPHHPGLSTPPLPYFQTHPPPPHRPRGASPTPAASRPCHGRRSPPATLSAESTWGGTGSTHQPVALRAGGGHGPFQRGDGHAAPNRLYPGSDHQDGGVAGRLALARPLPARRQ